ncbi:hypothetical protein [Leptospira dzoumogneensis]|uniref:Uncharacterized protein n=1 Tax=Leptospira dzoumogneensis TaxID=2484904 RepID=A0A4Z1AQA9_9LEPT|nr:hypothetical protein [Leptospira dzoumogneensis]TGM97290.1 hypothetical protein EHR06_14155 [Leptospira dzoumogneensis]
MNYNPIVNRIKLRLLDLAKYHNLKSGGFLSVQNITGYLMDSSKGPVEKGPDITEAIKLIVEEGLFTVNEKDAGIFLTDSGFQYINENA